MPSGAKPPAVVRPSQAVAPEPAFMSVVNEATVVPPASFTVVRTVPASLAT